MTTQIHIPFTEDKALRQGDTITLVPPLGCCNSTLCFTEWAILSKVPTIIDGEPVYKIAPKHANKRATKNTHRFIRLCEVHQHIAAEVTA